MMKIKRKRAAIASLMVCLLAGVVAAAIYSNTMAGDFTLTATYPKDSYSNVLFGKYSFLGSLQRLGMTTVFQVLLILLT
jgi:hypothetical protein